jgi:hypothetical protein
MFRYKCNIIREKTKLLQSKEPTSNRFAVAFGFQGIDIIFPLKIVHLYRNMLEKLI